MKVITLWQPWASFVADGEKKIETRSFQTKHRGLLAIHAAKTKIGFTQFANGEKFSKAVIAPEKFPFGKIICVVSLSNVCRTEEIRKSLSSLELALGNYENGRFAWQLKLIHKFKMPIPEVGKQGFWNYELSKYFKEIGGNLI